MDEPTRPTAAAGRHWQLARRVGRGIRDAWLILGITLALIALLEVAYRTQASARQALFGTDAPHADSIPAFPFDTTPWAEAYRLDHVNEETLEWEPYVYVRNPTFAGTHMSVDSAGHRVTPQPIGAGSHVVDVFFFGGSTMFGWFQRDGFTIPAVAARELQDALEPGSAIRVTNFGAPGRVFTQEIIELMLQLRAGARPDAVVFYDGINDVMAAVQNGLAGIPQNEANRVADFERGRRIIDTNAPACGLPCPTPQPPSLSDRLQGLVTIPRRVGNGAWAAARHLALVQDVLTTRIPHAAPLAPVDSLVASLTDVYVANVELVEALADRYGFMALYVWQPALLSSHKRLTARETWLFGQARGRFVGHIKDIHVAVPASLRDTVPALVGERFVDATAVFDGDTLDVFTDVFGHTYERANPIIVAAFLPELGKIVRGAPRAQTRGPAR